MRDALMNRGMADDAYLNRPTALAYSYVRNTMTIDRMTEFANNSLAAMDSGEWQRPALPGYDPAVQWTSPKEENLQALTSLSNNLTDVPALLAHVHETYLSLQSNFDGRDSVQHDSFLAIYRHHPAAADHDADQDADHPQSILLREALTDLEQSRAMLNWCQHDTLLDQMKQAVTSGNVDQTRDRMIEAGVGWDQLWTLGDQAEGRRSMYDPTHRDPQTMLGRAANRLAHADFAITMAYNPARIPDA